MVSKYHGHLLRSCPNGGQIWIGDVGDDRCCRCWSVMDGVRTDFGFSFDAAPTIDTVLYFRVETKEDGVGRRKTELT